LTSAFFYGRDAPSSITSKVGEASSTNHHKKQLAARRHAPPITLKFQLLSVIAAAQSTTAPGLEAF
jgi:hypothetical protein